MTRRASALALLLLLALAPAAFAEWETVSLGVEYQKFSRDGLEAHATRIDLREKAIRVIASRESERGMRVSEFARRNNAIVAINGDYFDQALQPIGLTIGPCGPWRDTIDTKREGFLAVGTRRAEIFAPVKVVSDPPRWIEHAISGWPLLINQCRALGNDELPGRDQFTRSPHPRTAVGLTKDGRYLLFVVADGRREGVAGLTLGELAKFMKDELDACVALNLDGGGSSAMAVRGEIVNQPSDGTERRVSNHLAVVWRDEYSGCDATAVAASGE